MKRLLLVASMLLLSIDVAHAVPITVRVPASASYSDGTPLPASSRIAAKVYCGPTAGRYVQAWSTESVADVPEVIIDVRARAFCAATYIAKAPDGTGDVESEFSVEFTLTPNQPSVPLNITTTRTTPALCTTVCTVDRRR